MAQSNPAIEALINAHGEGAIRKAFWLQRKIKRDGIDGIHYMGRAEEKVNQMSGRG
ncbi:hypothetical protein [Natronomonas gomsonensis]|uniref:hypothetical protein n=1 Tax=Natronomonas gomsonensis TaxID=1046043 RepID=UPI0015BE2C06|nr:hypothetical protein [Natronomonas gomsonensis]